MKQVYADFNRIAVDGSLPLTCASSVDSVAELAEPLRDREEVCFTDGERFAVGRGAASPPYQPKPPLWRSLPEKHVSPVAIVLGIVGAVGLMGALGAVAFEHQFFSGPATATAVTIAAVERTDPADDDSPSRIVYVVKLPRRANRVSLTDVHEHEHVHEHVA